MTPVPVALLAVVLAASPDSFPPQIPGYRVSVDADGGLAVTAEGASSFAPVRYDVPELDLGRRAAEQAASAARQFVFGHPEAFGLDRDIDSLVLGRAMRAGERSLVQFGQRHRGRVVIAACYAQVTRDGRVDGIWSSLARIAPDSASVLSPARAIEIASPRHPPVPGADPRAEEPRYVRFQNSWRLVYPVCLPRPRTLGYNVTVDAFSGEILQDYAVPPSDPR